MQIVRVFKGTLNAPALNYGTLLGTRYFVWQRLGGDHADSRYEIPYVIGWYCGLPPL